MKQLSLLLFHVCFYIFPFEYLEYDLVFLSFLVIGDKPDICIYDHIWCTETI